MATQARVRAGIPAGGQFAGRAHQESTVSLGGGDERPLAGTPAGTTTSSYGDFLIDDAPLRLVRDKKAIRSVLEASDAMSPDEAEIHANDAERWAARLYHPRVMLIRSGDQVIGTVIYEDGAGPNGVDINNIRIAADHRGTGAGSSAIDHLKQVAKHGKKKPRRLAVYNMLDSAKGFYARNGAEVHEWSAVGEFPLD